MAASSQLSFLGKKYKYAVGFSYKGVLFQEHTWPLFQRVQDLLLGFDCFIDRDPQRLFNPEGLGIRSMLMQAYQECLLTVIDCNESYFADCANTKFEYELIMGKNDGRQVIIITHGNDNFIPKDKVPMHYQRFPVEKHGLDELANIIVTRISNVTEIPLNRLLVPQTVWRHFKDCDEIMTYLLPTNMHGDQEGAAS